MYGALNNISPDVIEAARIDGAGAWQTARRIQIPLLRKWIVYMVILAFAGGHPAVRRAAAAVPGEHRGGRPGLLAQPALLRLRLPEQQHQHRRGRLGGAAGGRAGRRRACSSPDRGSSMPTDTRRSAASAHAGAARRPAARRRRPLARRRPTRCRALVLAAVPALLRASRCCGSAGRHQDRRPARARQPAVLRVLERAAAQLGRADGVPGRRDLPVAAATPRSTRSSRW